MASKTVAIIQSNYIPWIGYFAMMKNVDLFIIYECVQFTKNDWRNRNIIQNSSGKKIWLTVPVKQRSSLQSFMETEVGNNDWCGKHFKTLHHTFSKRSFWKCNQEEIKNLYDFASDTPFLYQINRIFIKWLSKKLAIETPIIFLESFEKFDEPTKRLVAILQYYQATRYITGKAAKNYIQKKEFEAAGIELVYAEYESLIDTVCRKSKNYAQVSAVQFLIEDRD